MTQSAAADALVAPTGLAAGAAAVTLLVLVAAAFRAPVEDFVDPDAPPAAPTAAAAAPPAQSASPSAPPAATTDAEATPAQTAPSVYEVRSRFLRDIRTGHLAEAGAGLDTIIATDPAGLEDSEVRGGAIDLAMRVAVVSDRDADHVFDVLATRTGTRGPDLLFSLVTTKGGSRAAKRAEDMLRDETMRARGTPALRIAYDLRATRCGDKPALFERAASEGDGRALGQLTLLNQDCRSRWRRTTECCFPRDPALVAAIDQLRARLR
jgi:hypothetical protein